MAFDPSKISLRTTRRAKETDPEQLFEALTLRGTVENLWSPQSYRVEGMAQLRTNPDVVVGMNTGGGRPWSPADRPIAGKRNGKHSLRLSDEAAL